MVNFDPGEKSDSTPAGRPRIKFTGVVGMSATDGIQRLDVLVVDDAPNIRSSMKMCLDSDGHEVEVAGTYDQAVRAADRRSFDLAFVDLKLDDRSGLDLIADLLDRLPSLKVIVITAYGTVGSAVEAMKRGAVDYISKPFSPAEIRLATRKLAELRGLENRLVNLESELADAWPAASLESRNPGMAKVFATAREVAGTDATILLEGDSGTGKGVLARAIHGWSKRSKGPFGVAHCPSFSTELLESELFGHVRGAFTGAIRDAPGRVARCNGGTLLLDEIGELPPAVQAKLLRFVQDREYERVGDPDTRRADVRLIAATNRDLAQAARDGRFREDLYYRLKVIELELPPLRERPEDVLSLARRFLAHYARKHDRAPIAFAEEADRALMAYEWPGNVRELENAVERAVILCRTGRISSHLLHLQPAPEASPVPRVGDPLTLSELEEEHIRRVISRSGTLEAAAETLGIDPSTLWRRRREYGI